MKRQKEIAKLTHAFVGHLLILQHKVPVLAGYERTQTGYHVAPA